MASLVVPVLQLNPELVLADGGECGQRCVPQPVLSLRTPKALAVFLPCPVEVQRTVLPILDHRPTAARRLHVTFSLSHNKDFDIIKPRFCWSTDSLDISKRSRAVYVCMWWVGGGALCVFMSVSEIPPVPACAGQAVWCRFHFLWCRACKSLHSPEDVVSPEGKLGNTHRTCSIPTSSSTLTGSCDHTPSPYLSVGVGWCSSGTAAGLSPPLSPRLHFLWAQREIRFFSETHHAVVRLRKQMLCLYLLCRELPVCLITL